MTIKQKKFVAHKVKGLNNSQAYRAAGYKASTPNVATTEGSKLLRKPAIQKAIDDALEAEGLSAEYAVRKIGTVAGMELTHQSAPSILKASNNILELHGWKKDQKPTMNLQVNQFFSKFSKGQAPIDGETVA